MITLSPTERNVNELMNLLWFGRTEVTGFTTVNMHHMNIGTGDELTELRTELFVKKNTGTHNNNCLWFFSTSRLVIVSSIIQRGLTTTRRDDNLTFVVVPHYIQSTLLMGTESDHDVVFQ